MFQRFSSLVNGRTATFNSTVQNFKPRVILLQLPRLPILQQLLLEEALYRRSKSLESTGWVLYNDFTAPVAPDKEPVKKSIILGRSQRPHDVVNAEAVTRDSVDMIRRYSGGGTVLLSSKVFMVTLILPISFWGSTVFPTTVMKWSGTLYGQVFGPTFQLRENDYTANGSRKFGGNAQAISRQAVVHHTSFIWEPEYKAFEKYLKHPKRQPAYRVQRCHADFVCGVRDGFPNRFSEPGEVLSAITKSLSSECYDRGIDFEEWDWDSVSLEASRFVSTFIRCDTGIRGVYPVGLDGEPLIEQLPQ